MRMLHGLLLSEIKHKSKCRPVLPAGYSDSLSFKEDLEGGALFYHLPVLCYPWGHDIWLSIML